MTGTSETRIAVGVRSVAGAGCQSDAGSRSPRIVRLSDVTDYSVSVRSMFSVNWEQRLMLQSDTGHRKRRAILRLPSTRFLDGD